MSQYLWNHVQGQYLIPKPLNTIPKILTLYMIPKILTCWISYNYSKILTLYMFPKILICCRPTNHYPGQTCMTVKSHSSLYWYPLSDCFDSRPRLEDWYVRVVEWKNTSLEFYYFMTRSPGAWVESWSVSCILRPWQVGVTWLGRVETEPLVPVPAHITPFCLSLR